MRRTLEAIALAAREEWIVSTRGADLPRSEPVFVAHHKRRRKRSPEEQARELEAQRERRAALRADTTDVKARRAWEMRAAGHFISAIAAELGTSNAQAGRYVARGERLAKGGAR